MHWFPEKFRSRVISKKLTCPNRRDFAVSRAMSASGETEHLLCRAADGDSGAKAELLERCREPLKRMIVVRMDPRVGARFDPSDVVQEALVTANQRLSEYLSQRPVAFYPWIRRIAFERLIELHRHHFDRRKRSVQRKAPQPLSEQSAQALADQLVDPRSGPVREVIRAEMRSRLLAALQTLPEKYREVLILRHLEQLSTADTAEVLQVVESTVKTRYYRAIAHLTDHLNATGDPSAPPWSNS